MCGRPAGAVRFVPPGRGCVVYFASLAGSYIARVEATNGAADDTDRVWASEWTAQVMLRFDPRSEQFEVFRSSSSTANVRQTHGRHGEVWTPESAADKLVVYRYR